MSVKKRRIADEASRKRSDVRRAKMRPFRKGKRSARPNVGPSELPREGSSVSHKRKSTAVITKKLRKASRDRFGPGSKLSKSKAGTNRAKRTLTGFLKGAALTSLGAGMQVAGHRGTLKKKKKKGKSVLRALRGGFANFF